MNILDNKMFCFQCQEAAGCTGCTKVGVCGKTPEVAEALDLLVYITKGISYFSTKARELGIINKKLDRYVTDALFFTITNVNFDHDVIINKVKEGFKVREEIKEQIINAGGAIEENLHDACTFYSESVEELHEKAKAVGVLSEENEDIRSLKEMIIYGLKGLAAYLNHANVLGYDKDEINAFTQSTLAKLLTDLSADELVAITLETGKYGVDTMALLDEANTSTYGSPEVTKVNIGVQNKPGILVSGHDLKYLEELLEQSKDSGVDIYTHGEMLPAHYYPEFKKYNHFVGNYGNAWWKQGEEFEKFNGPIVMTTNCIVKPRDSYKDRIYTMSVVGYEGVKHIHADENGNHDFAMVIEQAKTCNAPIEIEKGEIIGGFAHKQVIALADKVVDAVKSGAIKRFFVMAGCDGRHKERNYYTDFAAALPKDTVILTAGCAKYKYNKLDLGDIGGIPRVLDAGQCNDSYSLAVIALKLKEVFELNDINDLPISFNIAWYEQKAVIVLLALLHLGVKNIHLGPTLPAFLSPNVANVLVENFGIGGITNVEDDINMFMNN